MMNGSILLKVKCKEILQQTFSHLKTIHILKLIKNNKSIQNRIGITKEIFKNNSDLPKYEYKILSQVILLKRDDMDFYLDFFDTNCFLWFSIIMIYYLVAYAFVPFVFINLGDYTGEIYDINSIKKIKLINISLFILFLIALLSFTHIIPFVSKNCQIDFGFKKYIKSILLIFILVAYLFFEILIMYKIHLINYIENITGKPRKKGSEDSIFDRLLAFDYIFITINPFYVINFIQGIYFFFKCVGKNVSKKTKIILISYNKIKLKKFELPLNFESYNKLKRKKYIEEKVKYYQYLEYEEQSDLLDLLNSLRQKYELPDYNYEFYHNIPWDMLILPSEAIFFKYQNIFKIGFNKYILKYPFGEFRNKLIKEDSEIIK